MVSALAESRVDTLPIQGEWKASDRRVWKSVILGQYLCISSVLFVKIQAACLTARMGHLGEGTRQAAGRGRGSRSGMAGAGVWGVRRRGPEIRQTRD